MSSNQPEWDALEAHLSAPMHAAAEKLVREADVEEAHRKRIAAAGGISYKFTSPARRSVPDRLDLLPIPAAVRHVVAQYVQFTECKRPGARPTKAQHREHERLRALGFTVNIVDSKE